MENIESITYEQCPYDWEHVSEIYQLLPHEPNAEGMWEVQPSEPGREVRFRRRHGYFQFFYGDPSSSLFHEVLDLEPMRTEDDAEWTVEKHDEGEYLVRTVFTQTYGPVDAMGRVDELFGAHGLWLENRETHASGAATFAALNSESLRDACDRLTVIEEMCLTINKAVTELLTDYWDSVANQIQSTGREALSPHRVNPKRRIPIPPNA